jgi:hypothetical protein
MLKKNKQRKKRTMISERASNAGASHAE